MTTVTTQIDPVELKRGDRIEDGSTIGLVVKSVTVRPTGVTTVTDLHGWTHEFGHHVTVRLPRESGLDLLQ